MGSYLYGFVEIRDMRKDGVNSYLIRTKEQEVEWEGIINLEDFTHFGAGDKKNYNLFGILSGQFWYHPSWDWEPIKPEWGWPDDPSERSVEECMYWDNEKHEWQEPSTDWGVWMYPHEIEAFDWKSVVITDQVLDPEYDPERHEELVEEYFKKRDKWEDGGKVGPEPNFIYMDKKINMEDFCSEFTVLRKVMQVLVETYGEENVRLLIWFDS